MTFGKMPAQWPSQPVHPIHDIHPIDPTSIRLVRPTQAAPMQWHPFPKN